MAKTKITPRERKIMDLFANKANRKYMEATEPIANMIDKGNDLNELLLLRALGTKGATKTEIADSTELLKLAMLETLKALAELENNKAVREQQVKQLESMISNV